MQPFTDLQAASSGIMMYLATHGAALPEGTRDAVIEAMGQPSPVDNLWLTLEALYAARAELNDDGKELVAKLANLIVPYGWHNIQTDNRGFRIQQAMLRDIGEEAPIGQAWPDPETDPETASRFATVAEPEPAAPVPGGAEG